MSEKIKGILPYIIIVLLVILIKVFVVTPIRVNGPSMEPTLHHKDIMILNKTAYYFSDPSRFDIVVVKTNKNYIIKRVIGLPGEEVSYHDNQLFIDGKKVDETISNLKTEDFTSEELGSKKIPEDCYLVLGDNRENSFDSRSVGFIKRNQLMGKTSVTIFPISRFGKKN